MSVCNVYNIVNENMRGYINQQDLLYLLKSLFPQVTDFQDFQLNVWFISPPGTPQRPFTVRFTDRELSPRLAIEGGLFWPRKRSRRKRLG
jgi:hypothetical protein